MGNPAPTPRKIEDTLPEIMHEPGLRKALGGCSHWKIWDLCHNDPEFPAPREIAGKRAWFVNEVKDYIESRPRRIYAAVVALLAVVSFAAPFLTKISV